GSTVLKVMRQVYSAYGEAFINDFSGGAPVTAFFASFDLLLGQGTTPPADGFSFNLATNFSTSSDPYLPPREEGFTNGLSVSFDTWDNFTEFGVDDTAPAIEAKVFGRQIAFQATAGGNRVTFGVPPSGPVITDPATGNPFILETDTDPISPYAPVTIELRVD